MPKMTVLEMTQDILNDLDSDSVNSIDDTVEALQIAQILQTTYFEIIDGVVEWPHLNTLLQLDSSADVTKPTHMQMPESLQEIKWIKYNKRKSTDTRDKYSEVKYLTPQEFVEYCNQRVSSASTVTTVSENNVDLFIRNDTAPTYWTSFDDEWVVFDSHDNTVDTTLQTSKVQAEGPRDVTFSMTDTFEPDLPAKAFSYLLAEAKSVAFNTLKQAANPKEEQRSRRQRYRLAGGGKYRTDGDFKYASYGRKP